MGAKRHIFRGIPRCFCRSRSRLPCLRSDASSTPRHFLRARHSLGSTSLEERTGGVPRTFRPTSATQTSIQICHPCSRRSSLERALTRPLRGTRRFTPAEPALAGPLDSARAVHSRVSWRSSPLTPLSRSPLVTPASQPSVHLRDPPKMTSSRAAVKADAWLPSPETPSTGADSSAYPLAEVVLLRRRLESLRSRRYAPSIEDDFFRQRRLVLMLLAKHAREVFPRRLAPAREPLSSAYAT